MLMEDFRLSPEIVEKCRKETLYFCKGFETGGKTIHCLMKHAREDHQNFSSGCQVAVGFFFINNYLLVIGLNCLA